jgi:hypothetical protein
MKPAVIKSSIRLLCLIVLTFCGGANEMCRAAEAANSNSLRVIVKPSKTQVRINEPFQVALRVENVSATNQHLRVMNCSWDEHWKTSNTNITWLDWNCSKNFAATVELTPEGAYTNRMEMLVPTPSANGKLSFRMGFTPIDGPVTLWSDEVVIRILSAEPASHEGEILQKSFEKRTSGKDKYRAEVTSRGEQTRTVVLTHESRAGGPVVVSQLLFYDDKVIFAIGSPEIVSKLGADMRLVLKYPTPGRRRGDPWPAMLPEYVVLARVMAGDQWEYLEVWERNGANVLVPVPLKAGQTIKSVAQNLHLENSLSWGDFLSEEGILDPTNRVSGSENAVQKQEVHP